MVKIGSEFISSSFLSRCCWSDWTESQYQFIGPNLAQCAVAVLPADNSSLNCRLVDQNTAQAPKSVCSSSVAFGKGSPVANP